MISIVITAYNYDRYIERAIRSCLNQSINKNSFEIIVVNDASTDHTEDVLENYKDEVRVFNLTENVGLSAARNFGVKKSKGQYVVFLDADDYIHRDLLYVQSLFLEGNNAIHAVSTDYFLVDEFEKHLEQVNAEERPIACGIMFRKELLFKIGLYDEEFLAREEEDLRIRYLKNFNIYNIIIPLYRYRKHDSNLTSNDEKMDEFAQKLKEKHELNDEY